MAESGETAPKKLRTDNLFLVLEEFRSNKAKCLKLKNALESLHVIGVAFLKVLDTNARSPVSLSKATCSAHEIWVEKEFPACLSFRSIFTFGYKLLSEFLISGSVPRKEIYKEALRKLLQFLLDDSEDRPALMNAGSAKYGSDKNWALVLIQHLISKLSVTTEILANSATMKEANCCPCDKKEIMSCKTGNTSIGCVEGWQGELDILIGEIPVKVAQHTEDSSFEEDISQSSLSAEVNKDNFTKGDLNQMLAQTILFSFYKGKGLIPSVGLGSSFVKLHFYDCVKDILMRSNTVNLILSEEQESFETVTILMLWLTLNYELFCSGVPDEFDHFKAGFHEELGPFLECYKNTTAPFPFQLKCHAEEKEPTYRGYYDNYKDPDIEY